MGFIYVCGMHVVAYSLFPNKLKSYKVCVNCGISSQINSSKGPYKSQGWCTFFFWPDAASAFLISSSTLHWYCFLELFKVVLQSSVSWWRLSRFLHRDARHHQSRYRMGGTCCLLLKVNVKNSSVPIFFCSLALRFNSGAGPGYALRVSFFFSQPMCFCFSL